MQGGHTDAVRALAEGGADVDARRANGTTAALLAARGGHAGTVQALAALGADLSAARADGLTPAGAAVARGHAAVLAALADLGVDCGGGGCAAPTGCRSPIEAGSLLPSPPVGVGGGAVSEAGGGEGGGTGVRQRETGDAPQAEEGLRGGRKRVRPSGAGPAGGASAGRE